jgi:protein phosphatase
MKDKTSMAAVSGQESKRYEIPDFCLVVLIGASGAGKSSFARRWFRPTEIISTDRARELIADDQSDQEVSSDAFDLARFIVEKRLKHQKRAVIDTTNVHASERRQWLFVARRWNANAIAIVLDPGLDACLRHNESRPDRCVDPDVLRRLYASMQTELATLRSEGFQQIIELHSQAEIDSAHFEPVPRHGDRRPENSGGNGPDGNKA